MTIPSSVHTNLHSFPSLLLPSPSLLHFLTMALIFLLLILLFHSIPTTADPLTTLCESKGNYTNNGTYESNLNLLLTSLSSSNRTFSTDSKGSIPEKAYGLTLCRGDINSVDCSTCLHNAAQDILALCPNYKQASIWYDNCQLRYSDRSFFSSVDNSIVDTFDDPENETDPDTFGKMAMELIDKLFNVAAYNSSLMFTTGRLLYRSDLPGIYGMVQCTRDLTRAGCGDCFAQIRVRLRGCCYGKRGARVVGRSCNLRYEVYSFFEGEPSILLSLPVTSGGTKNTTNKVLAIVIPTLVALVLIIIVFILFCKKRSGKKIPDFTRLEEFASIQSLLFDLSVLKVATTNFADENKLGQGAFGTVYKGTLLDGQEIAVKRLSANSKQGVEELKNELVLVAKLQHKNLVRLRGICLEEAEKLLIYEYVPNRSLDTILFDPIKRRQLNWERRFHIILGIARGLRYLHEESQLKVIHRDLKASNVLLDADMNPKISDFGLARLFGEDETDGMTSRVVGTFGYMAPEYALRGQFSIKLDVFSFGVLVLEIVTGKKNTSFRNSQSESANDLLSYTWEHWNNGKTTEIIDPTMVENYSENDVVRCIQIGLLCAQEFPGDRPPMSLVILMLNSSSMTLPVPLQPAFCGPMSIIKSELTPRQFGLDFDDWLALQSRTTSPNEGSVSDIEPR